MIKKVFRAIILRVKGEFLVKKCGRLLRKRDKAVKNGHLYRALDLNNQADMLVKKGKEYLSEIKQNIEEL